MYVKYYLRKKERGEDGEREKKEGERAEGRALRRELQQRKESAKKSQPRERDRATFTVFFYPFLDHVTETQM